MESVRHVPKHYLCCNFYLMCQNTFRSPLQGAKDVILSTSLGLFTISTHLLFFFFFQIASMFTSSKLVNVQNNSTQWGLLSLLFTDEENEAKRVY